MISPTEESLRKRISKERSLEMVKYGRTKIYDKVITFLHGDKRTAFSLINHALAIIDDSIDTTTNTKQLDKAKEILNKSFNDKKILVEQDWEKDIFRLGQTLLKLQKEGFVYAIDVFHEIINYWNIENRNLNRKGKILNSSDLDKLNLEIGKSIGIQFLYFLCPESDKKVISSIASIYGFSIKLADNLSDLKEDLEKGYINISEENIKKHKIKLTILSEKDLRPYITKEFERVKKYYKKGDEKVEKIINQSPSFKKGLLIFKDIAHSWFKQVSEYSFIIALKQYDISNYRTPKFISKKEILKMEKLYGIKLSKIITLSYEQEARNTHLVKKKNLLYNPYSHKKINRANNKIKMMIADYPEIKNVLDLGCDDGSRTLELFNGKKLFGIEFVTESVKKAEEKGIEVYFGDITKEVYKDKKFDLVSLLGEMVNFVGLEVDTLLSNALKQVKENGYFLLSCMHTKFDKHQEGNYVVWSFKDFSKKKWLIKGEKIPRTFFLISKRRLLERIKNIAKLQNCKLVLKKEDSINNYYEDMPLGLYFFKKLLPPSQNSSF